MSLSSCTDVPSSARTLFGAGCMREITADTARFQFPQFSVVWRKMYNPISPLRLPLNFFLVRDLIRRRRSSFTQVFG